ncbi:PREDICTED: uncharacterized protein LOC106791422 [Polistes canadensis]|uniref:uncharacterized protein LOC106791422 n=1 Tax=Polistes canadensis TaxID=91411 RepID=UPI000718C1E3|nr:PREDICTED: uncharacterized protein LOC106791422 [Polistes canadensis]
MCCASEKVVLSSLPTPPEPLLSLLAGNSDDLKLFLRKIRKINSCFQMTSFGATKICNLTSDGRNFETTFKIQGQVYHKIGSLMPMPNENTKFLQIYFMGSCEERVTTWCEVSPQLQNDNYQIVIKADKVPLGGHAGRFNAPTVDEVDVIMVVDPVDNNRAIKITRRDNTVSMISDLHHSYNALQYPLIFWQLFHQYIVDMYAKIESERLQFIRYNQAKLQSDEYIHLRDAIFENVDGNVIFNVIGSAFILPSNIQDAMTYEIQALLLPGQQSIHRHDITARVFKQKLKSLIDFIVKYSVFGNTRCWLYSIELQKRAEISDPSIDQELFNIDTNHMIHGSCGAFNMTSPCIENENVRSVFQSSIRMIPSRILTVTQCIAAEILRMVATHTQCDCRMSQIK